MTRSWKFESRYAFSVAVTCGFVAAAATCVFTRDKWVEMPFPLLCAICVAAPALLLWGALLLAARRRGSPACREAAALCRCLIVFAGCLWAVFPLRWGLASYDTYKAKRFCMFLAPTIERLRAEHGRYPNDVDLSWFLDSQAGLPTLIDKGFQYHYRGDSFVLSFVAPSRPFAWYVFDSRRGTWDLEFD